MLEPGRVGAMLLSRESGIPWIQIVELAVQDIGYVALPADKQWNRIPSVALALTDVRRFRLAYTACKSDATQR